MYLTSRAIGQHSSTKNYLTKINQAGLQLPQGPIITSPDRLFAALTREVILRRPQEFKIAALQGIRDLFGSSWNPFYAGFGNRPTDIVAYRAVGVPDGKIFIINPKGEVHHFNRGYRQSYKDMAEIADQMFPPISDLMEELGEELTGGEGGGAGAGGWGKGGAGSTSAASASSVVSRGSEPRGGASDAAEAKSSDECSERVASIKVTRGALDEQFNEFNYWRVDPSALYHSSGDEKV